MAQNSAIARRSSRPPTRVSLACAPCRSKHLRCDATTPVCSRCNMEGLECVYLKSRRGGKRQPPSSSQLPMMNVRRTNASSNYNSSLNTNKPVSPDRSPHLSVDEILALTSTHTHPGMAEEDQGGAFEPATSASIYSDTPSDSSVTEQLLSQYYTSFHAAHPCVLPQWAMKRRLSSDGNNTSLQTLNLVMQYIGGVFVKSHLCPLLKTKAEQAISSLPVNEAVSGFDVQAALLLSIAIYWADEAEKGLGFLDKAIAMALKTGMNTRRYAYEHGMNDPVLEECWRRTWWQIYVTDAHIAGSTHIYPFRTSKVAMDVDLPCDEEAYESGKIPQPRTLQEYDMREFMDDNDGAFSSFAELCGLTRSLDTALSARQSLDVGNAALTCANTDAAVTAWRSLLPPAKKDIVRGDGSVDEILFKANIIIHTYIVDIHRQLSTLAYSPIEAIAHCAPPPPPESLRGCNSPECQLHTAKVLRAIEQFDDLLTLPTNLATHTPFIICMIANTVIAHLAACRYHYQSQTQPLKLARERIRLNMGALKVLGELWPMGMRTYREVGIVARQILGLGEQAQAQGPKGVGSDMVPAAAEVEAELSREEPEINQESFLLDQEDLVPDIQLLDSGFDFVGMFDLGVECT